MEPIRVGTMEIKNRIVFPPMNTNLSSEDGCVTQQLEDYYMKRAKGGAGFIVLEAASISKESRNHPRQPMICDRRYTASWARLIEKIHRYGTKVSVELVHYGSEASMLPRVSPSACSKYEEPGEVLTVEQIHAIQQQFVEAAKLAKQSNIDAITLHACHGYLIAEFLSPIFNKRTDMYGGSFENRCRFLLEIIEKCKIELGANFPIMARFSVDEFIEGGNRLEDSIALAKVLEKAGVCAIDISASQPSAYLLTTPLYCLPHTKGLLVPYSEELKKAVEIPVFTAIGIREPEFAEEIIASNKADLIAMGRSQLADPEYANKVKNNKVECIRHCLSCGFCIDTLDADRQICCAVNPETGRETEFGDIEVGSTKKKVVVVGGGPAGMEAARVAKKRGHDVVLLEKKKELGGTLIAAKIPPNKEMIGRLTEWYKVQLANLEVEVRLGVEANDEIIRAEKPDVLVLASGAGYIKRIKGSEGEHVIDAYTALTNPDCVGKNIVIVGGGATGAEVAEYFSGYAVETECLGATALGSPIEYKSIKVGDKSDKNITIVEMLDSICADMNGIGQEITLYSLKENGVRMCPSCRVEEITEKEVRIFNLLEQEEECIAVDTVILAGGLKPNEVDAKVQNDLEVIKLGDAVKPGKIKDAIYAAYVQMIDI